MKSNISFSDLRDKYIADVNEINEIDKKNIDYKTIIENKKKMIENYETMIAAVDSKDRKEFEKNTKGYMENIVKLENEIKEDEKKAKRKEDLIKECKKVLEDAKQRKEQLEKEVFEEYEKNKKDDEKATTDEVKSAKKELEGFRKQLEEMEREEIAFPNKVKDTKYKEFLKNKIRDKENFIKENDKSSAEEIKDFLLSEIKQEYTNFKMDITRVEKPVELQKPNPVFEKAKKAREEKEVKTVKTSIPKDIEINIGRKGKIFFDGKEYDVSKKDIKMGLNLSEEETIKLLYDNLNIKDDSKKEIEGAIKNKIIDSTIVNAICSTNMKKEDMQTVLKQYLLDAVRAKNGIEYKNNCNISYDKKDLSKSNLFSRIFRRELNASEKVEMLERASVGDRYAIAKSEGEYKPDRISRLIGFITRNKVPLLSDRIANDQIVATAYNNIRNSRKEFAESIHEETKGFTKEQINELEELHESQTKQEEKGFEK